MADKNQSICDTFEADLVGLLADEIEPEARARVEAHLAACPICTERMAALEETVQTLRRADITTDPDATFDRITKQIEREDQAVGHRRKAAVWLRRLAAGGVAATILIALFLSGPLDTPQDALAEEMKWWKGSEVTVYNDDLAVIKTDKVPFDLKKGINVVRYDGVPTGIDPTSVRFWSMTDLAGTKVLEQNYEYDLATSGTLLEKYLGKEITVVGKEGQAIQGILKSVDSQQLVLGQAGKEGVRMLSRREVRALQFTTLPEGLLTKPTLVWTLEVKKPGKHDTRVAYMTSGMSWKADYILRLAKGDTLALSGWATIHNRSGATYPDTKLKLIAGDVHRVRDALASNLVFAVGAAPPKEDAEAFQEKSFFEYHLYTLPRRVTLKESQTKQIELFRPVDGVRWERSYEFHGDSDGSAVRVFLNVKNSKKNKLGLPLPAGRVRVMARDTDGEEHLVGIDTIDHTPKDEELKIRLGNGFDLIGERVVTTGNHRIRTVRVRLRNHSDKDVTIKVMEHATGDWRIEKSSRPSEKIDATTFAFKVRVKKSSDVTITYTIQTTH